MYVGWVILHSLPVVCAGDIDSVRQQNLYCNTGQLLFAFCAQQHF